MGLVELVRLVGVVGLFRLVELVGLVELVRQQHLSTSNHTLESVTFVISVRVRSDAGTG